MNCIVKETFLGVKNGKKFILVENKWEFCGELWGLIKEFAGIYSFNINWDKVLLKNEHYLLSQMMRFPEIKTQRDFKKNECIVRKLFWEKINKGEFKEPVSLKVEKYNKKNVLEMLFNRVGVWTLPKEFQIGDEIQFYRADHAGDSKQRAGVIVSIAPNRQSYKIEEYIYGRGESHSMGYDYKIIYEWDKTYTTISTIKSDKRIKKGLTNPVEYHYYN